MRSESMLLIRGASLAPSVCLGGKRKGASSGLGCPADSEADKNGIKWPRRWGSGFGPLGGACPCPEGARPTVCLLHGDRLGSTHIQGENKDNGTQPRCG